MVTYVNVVSFICVLCYWEISKLGKWQRRSSYKVVLFTWNSKSSQIKHLFLSTRDYLQRFRFFKFWDVYKSFPSTFELSEILLVFTVFNQWTFTSTFIPWEALWLSERAKKSELPLLLIWNSIGVIFARIQDASIKRLYHIFYWNQGKDSFQDTMNAESKTEFELSWVTSQPISGATCMYVFVVFLCFDS